jgi:hypothetical protein
MEDAARCRGVFFWSAGFAHPVAASGDIAMLRRTPRLYETEFIMTVGV